MRTDTSEREPVTANCQSHYGGQVMRQITFLQSHQRFHAYNTITESGWGERESQFLGMGPKDSPSRGLVELNFRRDIREPLFSIDLVYHG